jgi:hypothetical protein
VLARQALYNLNRNPSLSFHFAVLGFELMALYLLGRCSTTWTMPSALILFLIMNCKSPNNLTSGTPEPVQVVSSVVVCVKLKSLLKWNKSGMPGRDPWAASRRVWKADFFFCFFFPLRTGA